ncbi:hypothetical protein D3C78_1349470 [compost metagenome]
MRVALDERFQRLIEVCEFSCANPGENLVAVVAIGHDLAFLDLEGLAEVGLHHVGGDGELLADEFGALERAADEQVVNGLVAISQALLGFGQFLSVCLAGCSHLVLRGLLCSGLDLFDLAGGDQLAFVDVLDGLQSLAGSIAILDPVEELQLALGSLGPLAVRLGLAIEAGDGPGSAGRIEG